MDAILSLLKIDLGITHTAKDEYFEKLLISAKGEITAKGITIDETNTEDMMLISDYAAWRYRKRNEDVGMPQNLEWRIRNRIVKARSNYNE